MKIKRNANEMAIQAPSPEALALMKAIFRTPDSFPYPTPEQVLEEYNAYLSLHPDYLPDKATVQFVTGRKEKGQGVAINSYPKLYEKAIVPLQELWEMRDSPSDVLVYLNDNPIQYRKDRDPLDVTNNDKEYVARCFSNLMDWIYLPSNPVYQNLREQLLEKVRYLRKKFSASDLGSRVSVLPQRPTTSRSLGEDELPIHKVNGGYRVVELEDPFTGEMSQVLELITWFFTDSQTQLKVYKDYFDIENGNLDKALRNLRRSVLYTTWAQKFSPKKYAIACNVFQVPEEMKIEELKALTPLY